MQRTPSFYYIPVKIKKPVTGFIPADINGADNSFKSTIYRSSPIIPDIVPEFTAPGKIPLYECCALIENTRKLLITAEITANPVPKNKA